MSECKVELQKLTPDEITLLRGILTTENGEKIISELYSEEGGLNFKQLESRTSLRRRDLHSGIEQLLKKYQILGEYIDEAGGRGIVYILKPEAKRLAYMIIPTKK